ncbi:uncharacterized protein LOC107031347 [Solanum pennellii]|uniref:Uncharacterized protein LOC107031347 n=1 Tax=Solanum pennellii TaxID=28526 RepID=A0ABM1UVZ7_SOLPN|nr:uncharacterized protein LOC107031347 [Solanum pennellii]XP_027767665.1 uncharacterized protein LOC107031347 [Solanum pennellii]
MGSSRQKDKNGKHNSSKGDSSDGTSARTRPLSFDEIMLRRKSKAEEGDIKNNFIGVDDVSHKEDRPKKTTNRLEPERHRYESLPSVSRHNSENSRKLGPNPTEANMMADKYARDKHRESRESEIKLKTSVNKDVSNKRLAGSNTDKDCPVMRRKDQDLIDDSGNETGRRHSRDLTRKEKSADKTDGRHREGRKDKIPDKDERQSYRKRKDMEMSNDSLLNEAEKRHSRNHGRIDSYADRTKEKSESRRRKHQNDDEERNDALLNEADRRHSRNHGRIDSYADRTKEKSESGRRKHRSDEEERNGALLNEAEKRHLRNHGRRDSYADRTKEKSESVRRKSDDEERNREKNADKKHSSVKVSEITGRVEASRAHLEEERPKRRRSRSRENDRDRGRRSRSGSPRGRKHSDHDFRERGEFSSHSSKDKSGRSHYDLDKKISSNGSDSHSNRHEGSTSGLGGYSPRKRKSEAAAKTPPPTNRSPERKAAWWDLPPASGGISVTGSVPSSVKSSMQPVIPNTHQFSSMIPASSYTTMAAGVSYNYLTSSVHAIDSVQLTQATRPMRRLYVENLPNSASEKEILDWINNFLMSSGVNRIQGTQPCISCMIHKEKCQALLEFLTPEDASAALSFDGRSFSGSILKIRRPKDFVEVATGVPQKSVAAADRIDDTVEDSSYKIFVGGISRTISSEMLMEIAKAFGPLKAYHFRMNSDLNEPCAFLEYVDHSVTLKACAGLNGMKLGGKVLTVVRAVPDTALLDKDENTPLYRIPQHAKPLLEKHTEVLKLKNVVDANVLSFLSEAELEELLEDIRLECARFGAVKSINVVKQSQCSLTSDPAAMDTSSTLNDSNMDFGEECDRNDPITRSDDHELEVGGPHFPNSDHHELEVGGSHIPNSDDHELEVGRPYFPNSDEPMETNSDEEAERCADSKTHISESSQGDSQKAGDDDVLAGGSHSDDRPSEELIKDDSSDPLPDDSSVSAQETIFQENLEVTRTGMVSERKDENANPSPLEHLEINNDSPVKEAIKSEEDNGNVDDRPSEPEFSSKEELDAPEELEKKEEIPITEVFDPGCVLVEFRRAEAACMAAHCLHGRLFDDRTVTVEYVPLDLYQTKFAKQN